MDDVKSSLQKLLECADQIDQITEQEVAAIRENPTVALQQILNKTAIDLIRPPFTWDIRTQVLEQMIHKITSYSAQFPPISWHYKK